MAHSHNCLRPSLLVQAVASLLVCFRNHLRCATDAMPARGPVLHFFFVFFDLLEPLAAPAETGECVGPNPPQIQRQHVNPKANSDRPILKACPPPPPHLPASLYPSSSVRKDFPWISKCLPCFCSVSKRATVHARTRHWAVRTHGCDIMRCDKCNNSVNVCTCMHKCSVA